MEFESRIKDVQKRLKEHQIDGWLLYDFCRMNDIACDFLQIGQEIHLTRRFYYWIPATGKPVQIVHVIESHVLDHLPGEKRTYLKWQTLEEHLKEVLKDSKCVAMEYSPGNAIPVVSKVDGGVLDLVRGYGVSIVSSAPFLQYYSCVWTDYQLTSHLKAAVVLDQTAAKTWQWIGQELKAKRSLTEYDVQQFILREIHLNGCIMDGEPIVGVNENSANPHYAPSKTKAAPVKKGDFILIDLWCKQKEENAVYADITRVAVIGVKPTKRQLQIFQIVSQAQKAATDFIRSRLEKKEVVKGYEVDQVCRQVIVDAGFGEFFTHRTGHNIDKNTHGPGANIDSLETLDERPLIPRTCFSIEPGIYLLGEFGIRLEYDVYLNACGGLEVTGGVQEAISEVDC